MKEINAVGKRVLFISDQHFPYHHKDTFKFLEAIKEKLLQPTDIIVNLGDETDGHAISFHDSDPDLFSPGYELEKACANLQNLEKLFPKMYVCESNHGSLIFRRMKSHGLPIRYIKPLNEIYGVSKKWEWHHEIILKTKQGQVYVCHGKSGAYGKLAKEQGMSAVQGHFHGKFELTYHKSATTERWNMFCGCLIDWESMAFHYGKNHIPKPVIGVGIISKSGYPHLIKMDLDKNGRWTGQLP